MFYLERKELIVIKERDENGFERRRMVERWRGIACDENRKKLEIMLKRKRREGQYRITEVADET